MLYNGTYTITNAVTGEYRTFRIKTQPDDSKFAPGERVIGLLSGPDNEADYRGFAFLKTDHDSDSVLVWKRFRGNGKMSAHDYFARLLMRVSAILADYPHDENVTCEVRLGDRIYRVQLSKRCARCNRKLTTPESLERGYGPECAARLGIAC